VVFFYEFQLIDNGDDLREDVGPYLLEVLDILSSYLGAVEVGALVLLGPFSLHELQQHQPVVPVSQTSQLTCVVQLLAQNLPLLIIL
jgi:hypothetical protein